MTNSHNSDSGFEQLLEFLKVSRGFDFTGYKRVSLTRRVNRRMQQVGVGGYPDYLDYLEVHPEEFTDLFNTILINVTSFFRDSPAWQYLTQEIVPGIVKNEKQPDGAIRVWSAGCASGEEAYTIAMILAETLGTQEFLRRVRIYATDVDQDALEKGRRATYTLKELQGVPNEFQDRYFNFTPTDGSRVFRGDLRKAVIFGRHDLIQDAPISRLDLLACRNTLMYFNSETQNRVLTRLHYALKNSAYLFLGRAEMLISHSRKFTPVSLEHRVFSRLPVPLGEERLFTLPQKVGDTALLDRQDRLRDAAFETGMVAEFLVGNGGELLAVNEEARTLFRLNTIDVSQPLSSLPAYYHPVELAPLIDQANTESRTVLVENVDYQLPNNEFIQLDLRVTPLTDIVGDKIGLSIAFSNMTRYYQSQINLQSSQGYLEQSNEELQSTVEELETTNEELQSSNEELETTSEELQSSNEELETTNEELQSSNEELETTNEELQSSNEELETTNEELQATNEELRTMNDQLGQRTEELAYVNEYLDSIFASVQVGISVLDRDLVIRNWNARSQDLWGLNAPEAEGKSIFALDIGLPVDKLVEPVNYCLRTGGESQRIVLEATNRLGRSIQCQVTCSPMITPHGDVNGVILMMEEQDGTGTATG